MDPLFPPPERLCAAARGALAAGRSTDLCARKCCGDADEAGPDGCSPEALAGIPGCSNGGACPTYCASPAPVDCSSLKVLARNAIKDRVRLTPTFDPLTRKANNMIVANIDEANADDMEKIRAAYPGLRADDLRYHQLARCRSDLPGDDGEDVYVGRGELRGVFGYQPAPALLADEEGRPWVGEVFPAAMTERVPVGVDRFVSPDTAIVLALLFFALVIVALVSSVARTRRDEAARTDTVAAWKRMVPLYEAEGRDMSDYRAAFGMGPAAQ